MPVDPRTAPQSTDDWLTIVDALSDEIRRLQDASINPTGTARKRVASPAQQLAVLRMVTIPTLLAQIHGTPPARSDAADDGRRTDPRR